MNANTCVLITGISLQNTFTGLQLRLRPRSFISMSNANILSACCAAFIMIVGVSSTEVSTADCNLEIPKKIQFGPIDSLHETNCPKMDASLYNYSVQTAQSADSLQSTEFSDTASGLIIGSFELEHCLTPSDSLLIVLGEASDSMGASEHRCRRLTVCNQMADGKRRRLRLQLSLRPTRSYTMKVFKLASGSRLCEQPRVRFFFTRSAGDDRPLVQLAARRCGACGDDGSDFRCNMTAYLRSGWVGGLRLTLNEPSVWSADSYEFSDKMRRNLWVKQSVVVRISPAAGLLIRIDFRPRFANSSRKCCTSRRMFFAIRGSDGSAEKLLHPQLCHLDEALFDSCKHCPAKPMSLDQTGYADRVETFAKTVILLAFVAVLLVPVSVLMLIVYCHRRLRNARKLILLVLPELENVNAISRTTVRRFQHALTAAAAGVEVVKVVGLQSLTRQLVGSSNLVVFMSADSAFDSFRIDTLSDGSRHSLTTLLLTEKHRFQGIFVNEKTDDLPANLAWSGFEAKKLDDDEAALKILSSDLANMIFNEDVSRKTTAMTYSTSNDYV